ncbi:hypothetical protein GUJ93_ZPchr0001g30201 [Zizania palustris]|uniref:Uncharacterized protein n=1 Tax=Zizania palustris TaxID=103762 RepID=A0A8J5RVC8_ZIZPA|nr:hypothetical protein GUJ93_ZPchr0001g30201 [Zizania palustris]
MASMLALTYTTSSSLSRFHCSTGPERSSCTGMGILDMSPDRHYLRKISRAPHEKQPTRSALLMAPPRVRLLVMPNCPGQARVPLSHHLG